MMRFELDPPLAIRPLDDRGRQYVHDILLQGLSLARKVHERLTSVHHGQCFALALPSWTEAQLYTFGGTIPMSEDDGTAAGVSVIRQLFKRDTGAVLVGESADQRAQDPGLSEFFPTHFTHGDELYLHVRSLLKNLT